MADAKRAKEKNCANAKIFVDTLGLLIFSGGVKDDFSLKHRIPAEHDHERARGYPGEMCCENCAAAQHKTEPTDERRMKI
jgi:hypothetical protein